METIIPTLRAKPARPEASGSQGRAHARQRLGRAGEIEECGSARILPFYRLADVCMVTSLHDGMNLVAKEFVAARADEGGALILSRFTGAAQELRDALIVNPYDTEQVADSIRVALQMDPQEKSARMRRMRETLREHNIYRWAGNLIEELTRIRVLPATLPEI